MAGETCEVDGIAFDVFKRLKNSSERMLIPSRNVSLSQIRNLGRDREIMFLNVFRRDVSGAVCDNCKFRHDFPPYNWDVIIAQFYPSEITNSLECLPNFETRKLMLQNGF